MKRQNQYNISIKFDKKRTGSVIYSNNVPYMGSLNFTDQVDIYQDEILISGNRSNIINLDEIFYNHNSSFYNQILKTLVYYYALNFSVPKITEIVVSRSGQLKILDKKTLITKDILQPVTNNILSKASFDPRKIEVIFEETEKGKSLLIALSYWIKAMSSMEPVFTFERLWRGFNKLYSFVGQPGNENERHRHLRTFTIANPQILKYSAKEIHKYTDRTLRNSFRWRGLILNDYATQNKTEAFKEFVLRYTDERVMKLIQEILPYRQEYLMKANILQSVTNHIATNLTAPIKSDAELISLLCIKYMYFVRNKSFHGEKIDGAFRLVENKETKELEKLNKLLSSYIIDLINSNDLY